jgi:hypothetical protein
MNRKELLRLVLNQAQFNGFEFRRWFQTHIRPIWPGADEAIALLAGESRVLSLIFSHEFARCFWRSGAQMSFMIPSVTYPRVNRVGAVVQVTRKSFTRRTIKRDAWKYHVRQMAIADDPVDYLCRFLPVPDQLRLQECATERVAAQA